ncbi:hypothetical protein HN011_009113 [Eciton burchellii]|nr:hypothetical protein HN011_009113 [Eciton burchellii]
MAPRARKHILQQENRLYMGFSSLKVRLPASCKVSEMPHLRYVAKHCFDEERCGRCGASDHIKTDCKSENQVCISCSKRKLKCNTKREDCPYRTLYQRQQENIDYGN